MKITSCDSVLIEIERVYKLQASREAYTIYNDETNEVLLNVPLNHVNKDGSVVKTHLCLLQVVFELRLLEMNIGVLVRVSIFE